MAQYPSADYSARLTDPARLRSLIYSLLPKETRAIAELHLQDTLLAERIPPRDPHLPYHNIPTYRLIEIYLEVITQKADHETVLADADGEGAVAPHRELGRDGCCWVLIGGSRV